MDELLNGLDSLQGAEYNPRKISKHDFAKLQQSIKRFGDLSGIIKNTTTGRLVGGHQRLEAFRTMQNPTIKVEQRFEAPNSVGTVARGYVVIGDEHFAYREVQWTEPFEKAANVAANRIQGEFDLDKLAELNYELSQIDPDLLELTGQTEDEINRLLDMVGANGERDPAEDEAPPVDDVNPAASKLGEIYQLGRHKLMCGDSTDLGDVSELVNGAQMDMIFTDPPYNVAYEGKTKDALTIQNDSMGDEDFYKFLYDVHVNLNAVTKDGGAIYVCHADSEGLNFRKALVDANFLLKQCIIWVKQTMVMGRQDYHWKHEPILYGWKDGGSHFFIEDRTQTTVWEIDRPQRNEEHPTMKPVELCERAILNSSKRGENIIDLFGGSGSTLMASENTDRICYMMELDPRYVDVIRKRYAKHIQQEQNWQAATPVISTTEHSAETESPAESFLTA